MTRSTSESRSGESPNCPLAEPGQIPFSQGEDFGNEPDAGSAVLLDDLLDGFFDNLENGVPPERWPLGEGWEPLELWPKSTFIIGGPTGSGKTSLLLGVAWMAMQQTPSLRVFIANNESEIEEQLERLTALVGQVNIRDVQLREVSGDRLEKTKQAKAALSRVTGRMKFAKMPFTLDQVMRQAQEFEADLVLVDTLQKCRLEDFDGDVGERVGRIMHRLREFASSGPCVLAAAQISREATKNLKFRAGSATFDDMDAAAFLYNSEIESSCDKAFLLSYDKSARVYQEGPDEAYSPIPMWLRHVKGRSCRKSNIPLLFDGRYQTFTIRQPEAKSEPQSRSRQSSSSLPPAELPQDVFADDEPEAARRTPAAAKEDGHEWIS